MKNLALVPHHPKDLRALRTSETEYEKSSGRRVADGVRDLLLSASPDFMARLQDAKEPDPWKFGFGVVHEDVLVGMCGFVALPDANGVVEIGYGIAPACRGKGYATEVAQALVEFASKRDDIALICAHTLPETNASTRVLEKCGFKKICETIDSENNLVWRWERNLGRVIYA